MIDLLVKLAPRERWLLGVLALAVLPVALFFGVLDPLADRRTAAEQELQDARALRSWVQARADEAIGLDAAGQVGPRPPIGLSALERSLIDFDLRGLVTDLANTADSGIELRFDEVAFQPLMDWLSASDPGWGYDIATLSLLALEDPGLVTASMKLVPQK